MTTRNCCFTHWGTREELIASINKDKESPNPRIKYIVFQEEVCSGDNFTAFSCKTSPCNKGGSQSHLASAEESRNAMHQEPEWECFNCASQTSFASPNVEPAISANALPSSPPDVGMQNDQPTPFARVPGVIRIMPLRRNQEAPRVRVVPSRIAPRDERAGPGLLPQGGDESPWDRAVRVWSIRNDPRLQASDH